MPQVDHRLIDALADLTGAARSELKRILGEPWRFYRRARIPKRDGTFRQIRAPLDSLKGIQRAVLDRRLSALDSHPANHCRRARSVITNAEAHLRHRYVAAYDLEDAFSSTRPAVIEGALLGEGVDPAMASAITRLCTLKGQLPQGAPTSPALLSIVLKRVDESLAHEARRQGLTYTRYMDDLFVSGGRTARSFERALRNGVATLGYQVAESKVRRWGPHGKRPTLAGVVLNTTLAPTPEFVRSVTTFVRRVETGEMRLDSKERASLEGMIAWVGALSSREGDRLRTRLRTRWTNSARASCGCTVGRPNG